MKKFFLTFLAFTLAFSAMADGNDGIVTRFGKWIDGSSKQCECPACPVLENGVVCRDTPLKDIKRPPFEIEARLDFFATPTGGPAQFHAENFAFTFKHNFSRVLNIYGSYAITTIDKNEYVGSLYDRTWSYQTFTAGLGWYIHPVIEIFGGAGKVLPKNSAGTEELAMAIEYGIKAHWAINTLGYKAICGIVTREVPLADEGVDINRSLAEASATYIFAGVALPVGW
jgi:hypothetical protein